MNEKKNREEVNDKSATNKLCRVTLMRIGLKSYVRQLPLTTGFTTMSILYGYFRFVFIRPIFQRSLQVRPDWAGSPDGLPKNNLRDY